MGKKATHTSLLNPSQNPLLPTSPTLNPCSTPPSPTSNSPITPINLSSFLPTKIHFAPSLANLLAISAPIPREAPVMMHFLPSRTTALAPCPFDLEVDTRGRRTEVENTLGEACGIT